MKIKALLLSLYLLLSGVHILRHSEALAFLIDGRPKSITYFHTTFMFTHIEIEVIKPEIRKDCAAFQSINIYIFSETYHLHHTISWRYIKFIET